jgi:hypothetical protein
MGLKFGLQALGKNGLQLIRVQADIIKCAMRVSHERPFTHAVLAEWLGRETNAYVNACTCYGVFLPFEAYVRVSPA